MRPAGPVGRRPRPGRGLGACGRFDSATPAVEQDQRGTDQQGQDAGRGPEADLGDFTAPAATGPAATPTPAATTTAARAAGPAAPAADRTARAVLAGGREQEQF